VNAWTAVEDEEVDICVYRAVKEGLLAVHGHTDAGEALYELTPVGMIRARAAADEAGYDPDTLDEAQLFAFAADLVELHHREEPV
jgi:hypothetical protein